MHLGDEQTVTSQIRALLDAGATDLWPGPIVVGDDPDALLRRTPALLRELLA